MVTTTMDPTWMFASILAREDMLMYTIMSSVPASAKGLRLGVCGLVPQLLASSGESHRVPVEAADVRPFTAWSLVRWLRRRSRGRGR